MCTFAGACLLLLCEITVLRLLPVFQSAHLLLIGFKFCVFMYVQGVYGVYLPLCVGVCLWACGGQRRIWVSCSVHSLLSPLKLCHCLLFSDGVGLQTFLPARVAGR